MTIAKLNNELSAKVAVADDQLEQAKHNNLRSKLHNCEQNKQDEHTITEQLSSANSDCGQTQSSSGASSINDDDDGESESQLSINQDADQQDASNQDQSRYDQPVSFSMKIL